MRYHRLRDGSLVPLPQRSIDTGMGLERLMMVTHGLRSVFETDVFLPWLAALDGLWQLETRAQRLISDHVRSAIAVIGDGVQPSNTGRGYVLRRLLRRALTELWHHDASRTLAELPVSLVQDTLTQFGQQVPPRLVRDADRVWEDAYITLQAVRNVWLGHGLTYQVSQPHVAVFTSPLGMLIPLLPEGIHQGMLAMRLSFLVASLAAVIYAHRLLTRLGVSKVAESFALAYIALDHSQVFFGMSGMETQVAVAIILAGAYYVYVRAWPAVGITCGLALLARRAHEYRVRLPGSAVSMLGWGRHPPGPLVQDV